MNIDFVIANEADAKVIAVLRQKIWSTTYRGIYPDDVIDEFDYSWHETRNLAIIGDKNSHVYLLRYGHDVIGYFIFQDKATVYMQSLYILSDYQRMGIGSRALKIVHNYCRNNGYKIFYCNCNPHNRTARAFYCSKGGVVIERDEGHNDKQEDQITFEFDVN